MGNGIPGTHGSKASSAYYPSTFDVLQNPLLKFVGTQGGQPVSLLRHVRLEEIDRQNLVLSGNGQRMRLPNLARQK